MRALFASCLRQLQDSAHVSADGDSASVQPASPQECSLYYGMASLESFSALLMCMLSLAGIANYEKSYQPRLAFTRDRLSTVQRSTS